MLKKALSISLVAIVGVVLFIAGSMSSGYLLATMWSPSSLQDAMVRAAKAQITLEKINSGELDETIDSLNLEIDGAIVEIQTSLEYVSGKEKQNACRVLLRIAEYRETYRPTSRSSIEDEEMKNALNGIDAVLNEIKKSKCNEKA